MPSTRSWPHWQRATGRWQVWLCVCGILSIRKWKFAPHFQFEQIEFTLRLAGWGQSCHRARLFIAFDAISYELNSLPDKTFHSIYLGLVLPGISLHFIFESRILLTECVCESTFVAGIWITEGNLLLLYFPYNSQVIIREALFEGTNNYRER